jgi:uncharacterized C2H2 Zn-finger protein
MVKKRECPKCGRKSLRFRKTYSDYMNKTHVEGIRFHKDENGNYYTSSTLKKGNKIKKIKTYYLEPGATTLRGDYKKFKNDKNCKYPKRLACNYGPGYERCEFMKYGGSLGHWKCTYEKTE